MTIVNELIALFEGALKETGRSLGGRATAVRAYTATRAAHLSRIVGEPGYLEAVKAEADNVLAEAGIAVVDEADAADARLRGLLQGGLGIAARVLAGV